MLADFGSGMAVYKGDEKWHVDVRLTMCPITYSVVLLVLYLVRATIDDHGLNFDLPHVALAKQWRAV